MLAIQNHSCSNLLTRQRQASSQYRLTGATVAVRRTSIGAIMSMKTYLQTTACGPTIQANTQYYHDRESRL
jgi:hypothetical protein